MRSSRADNPSSSLRRGWPHSICRSTGRSSTNCSQAKPHLRTDVPQAAAPPRPARPFANGQSFREVGLHQCPSERKGEGGPVRRLHVTSHVPSHPQTAAKVRGFSLTASTFTAETDWLLEGDGFELPVPRTTPGFWPISTRTT